MPWNFQGYPGGRVTFAGLIDRRRCNFRAVCPSFFPGSRPPAIPGPVAILITGKPFAAAAQSVLAGRLLWHIGTSSCLPAPCRDSIFDLLGEMFSQSPPRFYHYLVVSVPCFFGAEQIAYALGFARCLSRLSDAAVFFSTPLNCHLPTWHGPVCFAFSIPPAGLVYPIATPRLHSIRFWFFSRSSVFVPRTVILTRIFWSMPVRSDLAKLHLAERTDMNSHLICTGAVQVASFSFFMLPATSFTFWGHPAPL